MSKDKGVVLCLVYDKAHYFQLTVHYVSIIIIDFTVQFMQVYYVIHRLQFLVDILR